MFDRIFDWQVADALNHQTEELKRFNHNFERLLNHLSVPREGAAIEPKKVYVGEPISELEAAVRERAEELGLELKTDDGD